MDEISKSTKKSESSQSQNLQSLVLVIRGVFTHNALYKSTFYYIGLVIL